MLGLALLVGQFDRAQVVLQRDRPVQHVLVRQSTHVMVGVVAGLTLEQGVEVARCLGQRAAIHRRIGALVQRPEVVLVGHASGRWRGRLHDGMGVRVSIGKEAIRPPDGDADTNPWAQVKAGYPADSVRRFLTRVERGAHPCDWMDGGLAPTRLARGGLDQPLAGPRSGKAQCRCVVRCSPALRCGQPSRGHPAAS